MFEYRVRAKHRLGYKEFKLDADIEDFFRNIDKITFIESMKKGSVKSD